MSLTLADRLAREIESLAKDVMAIPALSRVDPDAISNAKIDAARKAERLAAELRNTFGGSAVRFRPGLVDAPNGGRIIRAVRRRRAA